MTAHFSWQAGVLESDLGAMTKLVLMVIGSYMNQHGQGAFPSYKTIADGASINRSTVIRHVEIARQAGWLKIQARVRPPKEDGKPESDTNLYEISFPADTQEEEGWSHRTTRVVAQDDQGGGTGRPGVVAQDDPNTPSISPQGTPHIIDVPVTRKAAPDEDPFEIAWKHYPKRAGGNPKVAARKAWDRRVKEGVDPQVMLAGVQRYAAFCLATGKEGGEYVLMAATFFGPAQRYLDAYQLPKWKGMHVNFQEKTYVGTADSEIDWLDTR